MARGSDSGTLNPPGSSTASPFVVFRVAITSLNYLCALGAPPREPTPSPLHPLFRNSSSRHPTNSWQSALCMVSSRQDQEACATMLPAAALLPVCCASGVEGDERCRKGESGGHMFRCTRYCIASILDVAATKRPACSMSRKLVD